MSKLIGELHHNATELKNERATAPVAKLYLSDLLERAADALAAVLPQEAGAPPDWTDAQLGRLFAALNAGSDFTEGRRVLAQLVGSRAPSEAAPRAAFNIALGALNTISALPSGRPNEIDNAKYLATRGISDAMRAASRPEGDGAGET